MKQLFILMVMTITSLSFKVVEDPLIVWRQGFKLRIEDFTQTLRELPNGRTAVSAIGLHMVRDSTKRSGWQAQAVFNKNQSYWYLSGQVWAKDVILEHEQLHFDITNYVAIMYNKVLDTMPYMSRTTLEKSYVFYANKLDSIQKWFDACVGENMNLEAQKRCNKRVDSLINRSK